MQCIDFHDFAQYRRVGWGPVGIEKTISVQKVFSKSCYLWSMLPEKPRLTSGFHKKVFMKRPNVHVQLPHLKVDRGHYEVRIIEELP